MDFQTVGFHPRSHRRPQETDAHLLANGERRGPNTPLGDGHVKKRISLAGR